MKLFGQAKTSLAVILNQSSPSLHPVLYANLKLN